MPLRSRSPRLPCTLGLALVALSCAPPLQNGDAVIFAGTTERLLSLCRLGGGRGKAGELCPKEERVRPARARALGPGERLSSSALAWAREGDWVLDNGLVRFAVAASPRPRAGRGDVARGALVDAVDAKRRADSLVSFSPALAPGAVVSGLRAEHTSDGAARVIVSASREGLALETTYELSPEVRALVVSTSVTNTSEAELRVGLDDVLDWGDAEPLSGLEPAGATAGPAAGPTLGPTLGAAGDAVSYTLVGLGADGELDPLSGSRQGPVVRVSRAPEPLAKGETRTVTRALFVSTGGGSAPVASTLASLRGAATTALTVLATGPRGEPVTLDPDARVRLRLRGTQGPWLTLGRGALVGELPALEGELELGVEGGGRALSRPTHVKLTGAKAGLEAEPTRVSLTLDEPGALDVQVRLGPGPAGRARVVVTSDATGALALDAATDEAGRLARPLQPGTYRVLAHRGARFSLAVAKVTLGAGQTKRLELDLVRERDDAPLACDLLGDAALGDERLLREAASRGLSCAAPLGSPPRPPSSEPARASAGRWYTTTLPSPLVVSEGAAPDLPALLDGGALASHARHGAHGAHGALAAPAPRALSGSSEAPLDLAGRLELVRAASLATAPPGEASALSGLLALVTPEARGRAGGDPSAALAASALSNGPALDVHVRRGDETSRERFTLDGRAALFVTAETSSWLPLESLSIHADGALVARVPARTEKTATGSLRVTWRFPLRRWTAKGTTPAPRALGPVVQRGRDASDGLEWLEGPTLSLPKGARLVVVAEGPVVSRPHFAGRPVAVSAPLVGER